MFKKIASNTIAQILSKLVTAVIAVFLIWILTKYLSIELYGTYNKLYNYSFIFAFLVDLWLYTITVKELSANKEKEEFIFWNIMTLRLFSALLVILSSVIIAYFIPGYNSSLELISIFILGFLTMFSLFNSSFLALMQANMKMEYSFVSIVSGKIVILLLTFLSVFYLFPKETLTINSDYAFISIMIIWVIGMFVNMILNYFYARKIKPIKFLFDFYYIKHIFKISLPYWIALFLSVIYTKIDVVLLSLIESWSIWERSIALYSLSLKIMDVLMMMWAFFLNSLLPAISESHKLWDIKKIQMILSNAFKVLFWAAIPVVALWIALKENIILLIATPDYLTKTPLNNYTSAEAFSIVLFILLFFYISLIYNYLFIATDKQARILKISIILTIINIVWNIIVIPYFSFIWAAIVTLITQILALALWHIFSRDILKLEIPFRFIILSSFSWFILYFFMKYIVDNLELNYFVNILIAGILFIIYCFIVFYKEIMEKIKKS